MVDTTDSSTIPSAPSLKRSLTKVKSVLSSTFSINMNSTVTSTDDHSDCLDDENHILKSMKYEETDTVSTATTPSNTRSNSNISVTVDELIPSLEHTGTASSSPVVEHEIIDTKLESNQIIEQSIQQRKQSIEINASNDSVFRDNEKLLPLVQDHSKSIISTPLINQSNATINNTLLPIQKIEEEQIELTKNEESIDLVKTSFEVNEGLGNLISPPISPSKQKPVFYDDPLTTGDQSNKETEQGETEHEVAGVNDFADAMALSILDKVDEGNVSTEWKI